MSAKACRFCGRPVVFALGPDNTWQILDTSWPCWVQVKNKDGRPHVIREPKALASHVCGPLSEDARNSNIRKEALKDFLTTWEDMKEKKYAVASLEEIGITDEEVKEAQ